ncbi:hypothetical protein NIES2109_43040 [Nostoc sp. HK-01]|uniref:Three potential zinc finger protein n=1 Tax=Nostoc cycadae WK-1 TaxID=1861711 RepID=A0A2H6LP88_9NOSO|nr:hypothetical protein [Nostoc cycadae]BBD61476.1 hypothetical protein NIES2109_43040 [Nostoc sp. HK-01]GBE95027.1 three potential zinc finger protein [Nostoc cycadae WK-1]
MARITISDLYLNNDEQHITELTAWEARTIEAGASTVTIDTSDLLKLQQNINDILQGVSNQLQQQRQQQQQQPNNRYGRRQPYDDYYAYY